MRRQSSLIAEHVKAGLKKAKARGKYVERPWV
jgi:DNA invertase Pin-like site-specific DNA recombinase